MQAPKSKSFQDYLKLLSVGLTMGAADAVPGVSGGTMAFLFGIYEELIGTVKNFSQPSLWQNSLTNLKKGQWQKLFQGLNLGFLIPLLAGIFISLVLLSPIIENLLHDAPVMIWSFFFGLIAASVWSVSRKLTHWQATHISAFILATLVTFFIVGLSPAKTPDNLLFLMLCGAIAICALVLPGISGALILVLLGQYERVVSAFNNREFLTLAVFALGAIIGLLAFARLLNLLFKRYHDLMIAVVTGIILGSLRKVWPWQQMIGDYNVNILPSWQVLKDGQASFNSDLIFAPLLMLLGMATILIIDKMAADKT
ncbi:MAG: DUF368 domain-containing protein [Deinococcales bacterium]